MILNSSFAVLMASGFVVPEAPKIVFPRPAIIRPSEVDVSRKNKILGMPLTLGMLASRGAPQYQSDTDFTQTSNTTGARTFSHATVAGTKCLVVAYGLRSGNAIGAQSCTYNGVAMTAGPFLAFGSSPAGASGIFYLFDPPIGTYDVSLTTTSNQRVGACAINTTAMVAGPQTSTSGSGTSLTVSVTTDQAAICIATSCQHQNSTSPTSQTGTVLLDAADGATGYGVSYTEPTTTGSQSFTHDYGATGRKTMVLMAFY